MEEKVNAKEKYPNILDFPTVGVGASAGGLEALQEFFKNLPTDGGAAYVVIQHLSPDYKSMMDELLARYTTMPIHKVTDGMALEKNHIYLIPPRKNMTVYQGKLFLSDPAPGRILNLPIDIFLRSLAKDQEKNAIGVILSGTGSDGTLGIRAVKEAGGIAMAQDTRTAKFDGMPRSSISSGMVDFILPPARLADEIVNYIKHPLTTRSRKVEIIPQNEETQLSKIIAILRDSQGVDFGYYKQNTILRRLEKRISLNRFTDINEYINFLFYNDREIKTLFNELLIGVTRFFRDEELFESLRKHALPVLVDETDPGKDIRIWVAGCSTGEEVYSLAILFAEYLEEKSISRNIKIFATDIDSKALQLAGAGFFPENIAADIPADYLEKYFNRQNGGYVIVESIRTMIVFARQDILNDPPFTKIDLVTCRNLLIYLNNEAQQRTLSYFYMALNDPGFLFLGNSESIGSLSEGFDCIDTKAKIYRYKPGFQLPSLNDLMNRESFTNKGTLHSTNFYNTPGPYNKEKLEKLFSQILDNFLPPSVIVDSQYNLIHIFQNINRFLHIPVGEANLNILNMMSRELSVLVSSLLRRAQKSDKEILFNNITLKDFPDCSLSISCRSLTVGSMNNFYLIIFREEDLDNEEKPVETIENIDVKSHYTDRIDDLEKQLQLKSESLQATVEELETSNEELQSSNEELIASNEELQSTNEELQSVNEELYTVNAEHMKKIEELSEMTADMENLLKNTQIGTLFLDLDLKIRKINSVASNITHITQSDRNRYIGHFAMDSLFPDFMNRINSVLTNLRPSEKEIFVNNLWFLVKMTPYRTKENAVEGLFILFIDITSRKYDENRRLLLFETMKQGVVYQNQNGEIIDANEAAINILGLSIDQMKGVNSVDPSWSALKEDGSLFPGEEHPAMVALKENRIVNDVIMGVYNPLRQEHVWIKIQAVPLHREKQGDIPFQVYTIFEEVPPPEQVK